MLDFLKNLLKKQQSRPNQALIHEMIERSASEKQHLETWQTGQHKQQMMLFIRRQLDNSQQEGGKDFVAVNTPKSSGFVLQYNPEQASKAEFSSMFDYFKQQVLDLNYKTYMSDVKQIPKADHVQTIERHYLKPRLNFKELTKDSIINQLYGNIIIEQYLKNEQPISIKFWTQPYTDHKYTKALPFQELAAKVFK